MPFNEQEISLEAKIILAIICEKYWNVQYKEDFIDGKDEVKALIKADNISNNNLLLKIIDKIKKLFVK